MVTATLICFLRLILLCTCYHFSYAGSASNKSTSYKEEQLDAHSCSAADLRTNASSSTSAINISALVFGVAAFIGLCVIAGLIYWMYKKIIQLQKQFQTNLQAGLKIGLGNRSIILMQQLKETEDEREEIKAKLQLMEQKIAESEKEKATDKTVGYLAEKQTLLNAKWKLEQRKEYLEKEQLNTEQQLQKAEVITRITDRKMNRVELINPQLEEVDSLNDTA